MRTRWYKNAVIYQVYPFSYMDSNNDGWGDIEGIISRLDYIKDLGVTAIWFSPLYQSPDYDYGYDISDYRAIDKKFGTMQDFDRLVEECHKRDLKVIMDMVFNHTSIEHEWFRQAIASEDSPYRDYYIIRKGKRKNGKLLPPSNWESTFTGSAWERIKDSDDFYLHLFCKEQADLNWENPEVRKEMADILCYWMDKGVDGFRFDVFNMFSKVYPIQDDNDPKTYQKGAQYFVDGPRMHEFLKELNERSLSHYDCYTVGESFHPSSENILEYVKESNNELDSIFCFGHFTSDNIAGKQFFWKPFNLLEFKDGLLEPQRLNHQNGWNTLVLENHDNPRSVSRFSIDTKHYRYEASTMLATITYLGFGTPFIYMGQEIGMPNSEFRSIDEMKDPVSHFVYDLMCSYHLPKPLAFSFIKYGARDHSRVPMAWDSSVNGGFNTGHEPWQCLNTSCMKINVEKDLANEKSIYRFYQKLLALRKSRELFTYGETEEYDHRNKRVIAYSRIYEGQRVFVAGNFCNKNTKYQLPEWCANASVLFSNYNKFDSDGLTITLRPYQAVVFEEAAAK